MTTYTHVEFNIICKLAIDDWSLPDMLFFLKYLPILIGGNWELFPA